MSLPFLLSGDDPTFVSFFNFFLALPGMAPRLRFDPVVRAFVNEHGLEAETRRQVQAQLRTRPPLSLSTVATADNDDAQQAALEQQVACVLYCNHNLPRHFGS